MRTIRSFHRHFHLRSVVSERLASPMRRVTVDGIAFRGVQTGGIECHSSCLGLFWQPSRSPTKLNCQHVGRTSGPTADGRRLPWHVRRPWRRFPRGARHGHGRSGHGRSEHAPGPVPARDDGPRHGQLGRHAGPPGRGRPADGPDGADDGRHGRHDGRHDGNDGWRHGHDGTRGHGPRRDAAWRHGRRLRTWPGRCGPRRVRWRLPRR